MSVYRPRSGIPGSPCRRTLCLLAKFSISLSLVGMNRSISSRVALSLALLTSSCGEPTKREFSAESGLTQRIEAFENELISLADQFDFGGEAFDLTDTVDPPPTADNTLTLSIRDVGSPVGSTQLTSDDYLSLNRYYAGRSLQDCYASEPMEEGWVERVEQTLSCHYLVIYWAPSYQPPVVVEDEKFYTGGSAELDVTLYDREAKKILLRFRVQGQARDRVEATAEEWKLTENLVFEINQLLRQDLLEKMSREIERQTGGVLYRQLLEEESTPAPGDAATALEE